jgi:hypothetical protein
VTSCSELAEAAGEQLIGTATQAERWLLLEVRSPWGRDALPDSDLLPAVKERLGAWLDETPRSRVMFVRKPERRDLPSLALFLARVREHDGLLRRLDLERHEDLLEHTLDDHTGHSVATTMWLVCTHGRRDPCCARLGVPLYDALRHLVPADSLWQSSHHGGHRFAANLLALPYGVQLGRVRPGDAPSVVDQIENRMIPLAHYRGRTLYRPEVQAAEAAVRARLGVSAIGALSHEPTNGLRVVFRTPTGAVDVAVEASDGPRRPESCGAEPVPSARYSVRFSS